jgi:hypothetical protein
MVASEVETPLVVMELPATAMQDMTQQHADTWNIVKRGWAKKNENNSVEYLDGEPCACVRFPGGSINPSSAPRRPLGGIGFYAAPSLIFPATDVELRYSLQFDASFEPQLGGKLPGLYMSREGLQDTAGELVTPYSSSAAIRP